MFGYLKDPLREVEQPYFQQDEVHTLFPYFLKKKIKLHSGGFAL